jgi:hypothetical protein
MWRTHLHHCVELRQCRQQPSTRCRHTNTQTAS